MKFIHIADVHLGARPEAGEAYSNNREREIWDTFKGVLELCEKNQIDLLLISGDLFHRQPLLRELKEVDYMFSKLTYTKVVFIVGNHDYLKDNSYYRVFVWSDNVYPILSDRIDCIEIEELQVAVYGCSYHDREIYAERLQENMELANQKIHILVGHGGDATHMPFDKYIMGKLPYDYIALGHIHKPEILIEGKMAYAGALEPTDIADFGSHGYMLGDIQRRSGINTVVVQFVEFAKRKYIRKCVEVNPEMTHFGLQDYLYRMRCEEGMQHMYHIELIGKKDPDIIFHLEELDEVGNVLSITDNTKLDYNMAILEEKNRDNLLGVYIQSFGKVQEGSIEYIALMEGVQAIEETKKG